MLCSVCGHELSGPLYRSPSSYSLTSLARVIPIDTVVYACSGCAHLQTPAIADIEAYYDTEYDILVASEQEDQIYEVRDGKCVYRTAHQVATLTAKVPIHCAIDLLDFGCAKSSTTRELCRSEGGITPHLYDVSERYIPFWKTFVKPGNWAIAKVPPEWHSHFDLITSFFSLEHIPAVADVMRTIVALLKPGGTFYGVVPNALENIADFIVVDHCNHFTAASLHRLLSDAGLVVEEIDAAAHRGAYVMVASKPLQPTVTEPRPTPGLQATLGQLEALAEFWRGASTRIRSIEQQFSTDERIAIYGAGFYGAFIRSCLTEPERVACHLDQNPYLRGTQFHGRPVLPPDDLPADVSKLLIGLNPKHARTILADIPALADRKLAYFYLN